MANGKLTLIGLAASTFILTACVTKVWEATYTGASPENHSEFHEIVPLPNGELYALGEENDSSNSYLMLLKYDSNGNMLWNQRIPGLIHLDAYFGNNFISVDGQGNALIAGPAITGVTEASLVDSSGTFSWTRTFTGDTGSFPSIFDTAATTNGVYLVLGTYPEYALAAFDIQGEELWQYDGGIRGDTSNPSRPVAHNGEVVVDSTNNIYLNNGYTLSKVDESGSVLNTTNADALGVSYLVDIETNGTGLALASLSPGEVHFSILDDTLSVVATQSMSIDSGWVYTDLLENGDLCFAVELPSDGDLKTPVLIGSLSSTGEEKWSRTIDNLVSRRTVVTLEAENNNCFITTTENSDPVTASSKVRIYNESGKITDTVKIADFVSWGSRITGNTIYTAGFVIGSAGNANARVHKFQQR